MKKILQILYSGLGGHGSVFFSLVEADRDRKFKHCAVFYGVEPLLADYKQKCEALDINYTYSPKRPGLDLETQRQFLEWMEEQKPDAVILHSPPALYACRKYLKKHPQVPLLLVEHNANVLKGSKEWILSSVAFQFVKRVVYLTESYRDEVKKKIGFFFKDHKAAIIPNGINTDRYCPGEAVGDSIIRIGMCGRISKPKDFLGLIDAFEQMLLRTPNIKSHLLLAGDGPDKKSLEQYVVERGLVERVTFLGLLNERDLVSFYQRLDIYAHSSFSEAMSTAVMQALSCAVPTIASSVDGMHLVLPHNIGVHVPPGHAEEMANAIEALAVDEERRKQMATRSREYAVNNLSNTATWEQYVNLLF